MRKFTGAQRHQRISRRRVHLNRWQTVPWPRPVQILRFAQDGGFSPPPRLQIQTRGMKNKKSTRIPGVFPVRPCTGLQYSPHAGKRKAFSKKIRHFRRFSADCTNRCPFPAFFFARFSKSWTALLAGSDAIFPQVFQAVPGRDPGRGGPFFLATGFDTKPHTAAQLLLDNFRKTHYHK